MVLSPSSKAESPHPLDGSVASDSQRSERSSKGVMSETVTTGALPPVLGEKRPGFVASRFLYDVVRPRSRACSRSGRGRHPQATFIDVNHFYLMKPPLRLADPGD